MDTKQAATIEGGLRTRGSFLKKSEPLRPLITVITVVYNGARHLEKTIKTVVDQTYDNIEYIVIDGASTDGTVDIIKKYENTIAYWISEPDRGIYDAMNKGVRAASGEWIYFLGCDDLLLDIVHQAVTSFTDPNGIYYGDVYRTGLHKLYDGKFTWYKLILRNISHQAIFYPKSVFKKYSFDLTYKMAADHALNIVCYGDKEFRFLYMPKLICIFHDGGLSSLTDDNDFKRDKLSLVRKNMSFSVYAAYCTMRGFSRVITCPVDLLRRYGIIGSKRG